jgi:hypothetical protein
MLRCREVTQSANKRRTAVQQFGLSASRLIQIFGVVARTL